MANQAPTFITALQRPEAYDHPVDAITLFETHISWVLLAGEFAYKIKKPVDFGFLDFSTLEKRRFFCEEELRLNRRLAPQLYLDVVPISGNPLAPRIYDSRNGFGTAFEYAVKMQRFDPQQTFDELLARNALTLPLMEETAITLAKFHQQIAVATADDPYGTPEAIAQPVQENFEQIEQALSGQQEIDDISETCGILRAWSTKQHKKLHKVFQQRKQTGFIRECHGDLHLRNIVLWHEQVIPFDGIEFNANLRWIDVMSELAFLLMDLDDHQQSTLARHLLNRYLVLTGDYEGLATLRYYQIYRAMVRAKVASLRLGQLANATEDGAASASEKTACLDEVRNYIQLASRYSQPPHVRLIITRGLSGSGKSYLAHQLSLNTELVHLRSDIERKRLFDLNEMARTDSTVNEGIYTPEATKATYKRLLTLAEMCIASGHSVIVDATFLKRKQRDPFHVLAKKLKCAFTILDCHTDEQHLRQRIQQRAQQGNDASEADLAVLEKQLGKYKPLKSDEQDYALSIDTTEAPQIASLLEQLT